MTTGYALSVAIFGGSAPYLSIWMIEKLGTPIAPVWYLIAAASSPSCVIWSLKETAIDELA
jgi:MHS family proline/betaine transporter-like MFS transporter